MQFAPIRLAENIALLQKICDEPIPPTSYTISNGDGNNERVLSLRQEREVVESLSYLSTYSSEPGNVLALCIEEGNHRLVVSVATNSGVTPNLETGLNSLVKLLEKEHAAPCTDHFNFLIRRAVKHGRARVVRYLGLHSEARPHVATAARLGNALSHDAQLPSRDLQDLAEVLRQLSEQFSQCPSRTGSSSAPDNIDILVSILDVADKIWMSHSDELKIILDHLQNNQMSPTDKESLMTSIGHLGRYKPATSRLLKYARKYSLFKKIELKLVHMNPFDLSRALADRNGRFESGLLNQYLHRPTDSQGSMTDSTMRAFIHHHGGTAEVWAHESRTKVEKYQAENGYKVHAEIQLILHYESRQNVVHAPRVVKSSKSACFLCDLFIKQLHGRWYTPKTHGVVYDRWMLPDLASLGIQPDRLRDLEMRIDKFNAAVEDLLLDEMAKGKRRKKGPREYDIFSLAPSTVRSDASAASHETIKPIAAASRDAPDAVGRGSDSPEGSSISLDNAIKPLSSCHDSEDSARDDNGTLSPITPATLGPDDAMADARPIPLEIAPIIDLQMGVPHTHKFKPETSAIRLHTPKIHIELSRCMAEKFVSGMSTGILDSSSRVIEVEAEWLDTEKTGRVSQGDEGWKVDLDEHWNDLTAPEGVLFGQLGMQVKRKREVVRLTATYL
ncbi:hypothetical protein EJ04DRAFT_609231 [Polyplosphaeria fusca]|uniref:Uncharacterized protein n=1 Tax=Polyplosphaeria fusca TaxID=682080 RepID=A0A9P4R4S9_9PLEO|nr:hypothetical protein EJ04DRAFT_609231 [Polyplosphaeria fusca]